MASRSKTRSLSTLSERLMTQPSGQPRREAASTSAIKTPVEVSLPIGLSNKSIRISNEPLAISQACQMRLALGRGVEVEPGTRQVSNAQEVPVATV